MKQHNHWKMSQFQKKIIKIVLWGFGLLLLFFTLILKKTLDFSIVSKVISFLSIVLGVILALVEKKLWKTWIMRLPFFENYWTPVLEGRGEGSLERNGEFHDFAIEIVQSFTSISCVAYSNHSSSSAYATEILYDDQLKVYKLIYYWHGATTNTTEDNRDSDRFEGFTVLDIIVRSKKVDKLKGTYFTNREPQQTKGNIILSFKQKTLKKSFD